MSMIQKKIVPFVTFLIVASPMTFKTVRGLLGNWVASADGVPTTAGLFLHALVYVLLATLLWRLVWGKKKSGYMKWSSMYDAEPPFVMDTMSDAPADSD
jgi:hypothetical protein